MPFVYSIEELLLSDKNCLNQIAENMFPYHLAKGNRDSKSSKNDMVITLGKG